MVVLKFMRLKGEQKRLLFDEFLFMSNLAYHDNTKDDTI